MNQVGDNFGRIEVTKKQEIDGAWVVCTSQRTTLRRTPFSNQATLTCKLLIDNQHYSTLTSVIIMKGN